MAPDRQVAADKAQSTQPENALSLETPTVLLSSPCVAH
jgi:hypothetical protein